MKTNFLFLLLFLASFSLCAQNTNEYSPGYILTNNDDTIRGEMKILPYSVLSSEVRFKEKNGSEYKKYTPDDLKAFCLLPNTSFQSMEITKSKEGKEIVQKYFVLKAVTGEINFFICYLPDEIERYYISSPDFGTSELKQSSEIKGSQMVKYSEYIFTLGKFMYRKPEFRSRIEKCYFSSKEIGELISDYNLLTGENHSSLTEKNRLKWSVSFQGNYDNYLIGGIADPAVKNYSGYGFGISNAFYLNQKFRETELLVDLNYRKNNYLYSFSQIELPVYFRYNNKNRTISPVVEIGFNSYYMLDYPSAKKDYFGYYDPAYQKPLGYPQTILHITDEIGLDYIVGLGLAFNNKNFGFKYTVYTMPYLRGSFVMQWRVK